MSPSLSLLLLSLLAAPLDAGRESGLYAEHLYNGVGQAIPLEARTPSDVAAVDLVLMDEEGTILAVPRPVQSASFDLAEVMPAAAEIVAERGRACYLQMLVDEIPAGSALVLQPMRSRLVPVTETAPHPVTAQPHTRIVGWRMESDGPPSPEAPDTEDAVPVFTGLRVYPERDVRLETTLGEIVIALRPDEAPNTAWNFRHLIEGGFYRGIVFHRVVPQTRDGDPFVIQAGDPGRTGDGGPGFWLPLEPSGLPHDFGVISMARADDPDSAGSQFFICLSRAGTRRLDGQYCAFGYAVRGARTVLAIADVELEDVSRGRPVDPPAILAATIVPAPPRVPGSGRPDERVTPVQIEPRTRPDRIPR